MNNSLVYNGQEICQRESDGYVNATQMAKANNVDLYEFKRSEFAKGYLKALQESEHGNLPLSVVESTGFPAVKTTWFHPLLAIAFAQWISPEFHVFCNIHIKVLMETGTTSLIPQPQNEDRLFIKQFIDSMYADIAERYPEIDKRLIDGAKLNGYGRHYPELKGEVEEVKHLISATSSEEKLPMSPTELGVRFAQEHCLLKVSAQKVNQALLLLGLQEKSGDKLCPYQLTSLGEEYGELQLETCKGHNKTVYRIRWYEDVISLIEDTLLKLVKTKKVSIG